MEYFWEKIFPILIDKLIIGILIIYAGYIINKLLESHKLEQNKLLESYKLEQNKSLEKFKGEQSNVLEQLRGELSLKKEYEVLRDKTALQHLQRQIEELYSPLLGLIQYSIYIFKIFDEKKKRLFGEKQVELQRYFDEKYFLPINSQIANLIRTKIYLIDSDELPESFKDMLQHEAQFACQYNLWKEKQIGSDEIKGKGWPMQLEGDVESTLKSLILQYNKYRRRIQLLDVSSYQKG